MVKIQRFEIGIDCTDINRFEDLSESFMKKTFTNKEIEYCNSKARPSQHFAARFAGKEAVAKALFPFGVQMHLGGIEIFNEQNGNPIVIISEKINKKFEIRISLTHSSEMAVSVATIMEK